MEDFIEEVPEQYSQINGKDIKELREELKMVKASHYSLITKHGKGYDVPTFDEMVDMFAEDDFYNLHFVAKEYKRLQYD